MKQIKTSSITSVSRYLPGSTILLGIVFLLGSCCTSFKSEQSSKKNCRCSQQELAANMRQDNPNQSNSKSEEKEILNTVVTINKDGEKKSVQSYKKIIQLTTNDLDTKKGPLGIKSINTHILAGPNISNVSKKEEGVTKKSGAGFQFGVGSNYVFSRNFAINPSLLFRQNNYSTSSGEGNYETKTKYSYNYLSVPIMANFRVSKKINIGVGPEINYLLSATSQTSYGEDGDSEKEKITDQSVKLGGALQVNMNYSISRVWAISLIMNKQINDLTKHTNPGTGGGNYDYSGTGGWVSFGLYVLFDLCNLMKEGRLEEEEKQRKKRIKEMNEMRIK